MSDEVTISSGGTVAVNVDALVSAADELDLVDAGILAAVADLERAGIALATVLVATLGLRARTLRLIDALTALATEGALLAGRLREAAAAYELVELLAARAFAVNDGLDTAAIDARIAQLSSDHPDAADIAASVVSGAERDGASVPLRLLAWGVCSPMLWPPALAAAGLLSALAGTGRGRIRSRDAASAPVAVRQTAPISTATPPVNLTDALGRIPAAGDARVRVERYDLPGGRCEFAVYVTGTKAVVDRSEAWNMTSNAQLFLGGESVSLASVRAALVAAGAQPGDGLYAYGYSQGGMIVDALAAEGTYDVRLLATAGSPTSFDAGEGTISVELRHLDDPVASLADGGFASPVGAEGSFVAERTVSDLLGPGDLTLGAHHFEQYLATASLVDASADPRVAMLQKRLDALQSAGQVSVYEFAPAAPVLTPTPAPAPQASPSPELLTGPAAGSGGPDGGGG